jgi:uncharacterized membrane protein YgcG
VAKPEGKNNRMFWVIFISVSVAAAIYVYFDDSAPKIGVAKKKTLRTTTAKKDEYLPEDYTAKFTPIQRATAAEPRNAFKPLVFRKKDGLSTLPTISNIIPPAFAGGQTGWTFTGIAEVDGTMNALVENSATGEGEYLKPGQSWKACKVLTVTQESIVLLGDEGVARTVSLINPDGSYEGGPVGPMTVPVTGNIGIQPLPGAANPAAGRGGGFPGGGFQGGGFPGGGFPGGGGNAAPAAPPTQIVIGGQ